MTDKGVEYLISFIEESNLGIENAYQLVISNKNQIKVIGTDTKIAETVVAILTSFFDNEKNILLYICDTIDKHEAARNRKFTKWFQRYADTNRLAMETEIIQVDDTTFFISILYNKSIKDYEKLKKSFHDYFQDLRSKLD